jgi:hypothetical protein
MAAEKNLEFRRRFVGKTLELITLQTGNDEWTEALSDNYLKVRVEGRHAANQILTAAITGVKADEVVARLSRHEIVTVSALKANLTPAAHI